MFITEEELNTAIFSPMTKGNKLREFTDLINKVRDRIASRNIIGGPQIKFQAIQLSIMQMISVIKSTHSAEEKAETLAKCTVDINNAHDILLATLQL